VYLGCWTAIDIDVLWWCRGGGWALGANGRAK
jgi:hypothetical protein